MPPAPPPVEPLSLADAGAFLLRIGFVPHPSLDVDALDLWSHSADPSWLRVKVRMSAMRRYVHTIILYVPYKPARYGKRGLCKGYKNPKHEIRFPAPHNWEERAQRWLAGTGAQHILRAKKQQANAISIANAEDRQRAELDLVLDEVARRLDVRRSKITTAWSEQLEGLPRKIEGIEVTFKFRGDADSIAEQIRTRFPKHD